MSERVTSSSKRERGADAPARPPLVQQASQRRLSDAHEALSGGDIRVESEPGKGSSFHVFLPRLADAGDEEEPHPSTVAADRGTEDLVLAARDGAEALAVSQAHAGPIDLMITDVVMPGMNGKQLAEELRASRPGIRVLFISGYPE